MIVVQNAGIERTSVSHAALIVGVVPVLVALMAAALGRGRTGPLAWLGFALALAGVGLVAGGAAAAHRWPATGSCWRRSRCRPPPSPRSRACSRGATRSP